MLPKFEVKDWSLQRLKAHLRIHDQKSSDWNFKHFYFNAANFAQIALIIQYFMNL